MLGFHISCNGQTLLCTTFGSTLCSTFRKALCTTFGSTFGSTLFESSHDGSIHDTKGVTILPESNVILHAFLSRQ